MKIHLLDTGDTPYLIRAHTADSITIGNTAYTQSLVISPASLLTDWGPQSGDVLAATDLDVLLELGPELVLIGTGAKQVFPSGSVLQSIVERQIGYEIMNTPAACRTYNILVAEGRTVVAGLIIP